MSTTVNVFLATLIGFFLVIGIATSGTSVFDAPASNSPTINKIQNNTKKLIKSEKMNYKSDLKKAKSDLKVIGISLGS